MESRVRQLQAMLADAVIVDDAVGSKGIVNPGVVVEIRYEGDEETERYLVGSIEERREGVSVISPGSPLGKALIGKEPGDKVEYEAPSGVLNAEIISIGG
jgi:transcription elongation factor GreA